MRHKKQGHSLHSQIPISVFRTPKKRESVRNKDQQITGNTTWIQRGVDTLSYNCPLPSQPPPPHSE